MREPEQAVRVLFFSERVVYGHSEYSGYPERYVLEGEVYHAEGSKER